LLHTALKAEPGPTTQARGVFTHRDNRVRSWAKTQEKRAAKLSLAKFIVGVMSEGTAESLQRAEPFV